MGSASGRKTVSGAIAISLFVFWGIFASTGFAGSPNEPSYDDVARFIAGMKNPSGPLAAREARPAWIEAARFSDESWKRFRRSHLGPMGEWAAANLKSAAASRAPLFYPFSGPDFASMYALFPESQTYLMLALDSVGKIPDFAAMDADETASFFASLQQSLDSLLHLGFFKTKELKVDLQAKELEGVLPLLLYFMAREDLQVLDVRYWSMSPEGSVHEVPAMNRDPFGGQDVSGVKISFQKPSQAPQTLYYFRCDLSDGPLTRKKRFIEFLNGFGGMNSLIKAASYLMFEPDFSVVKEFILDRSLHVLQTDSGIPLKDFDPSIWNLKFFGVYTGPIPLFKRRHQEALAATYRNDRGIAPLPFGIGYHFRVGTSNLMLATRK